MPCQEPFSLPLRPMLMIRHMLLMSCRHAYALARQMARALRRRYCLMMMPRQLSRCFRYADIFTLRALTRLLLAYAPLRRHAYADAAAAFHMPPPQDYCHAFDYAAIYASMLRAAIRLCCATVAATMRSRHVIYFFFFFFRRYADVSRRSLVTPARPSSQMPIRRFAAAAARYSREMLRAVTLLRCRCCFATPLAMMICRCPALVSHAMPCAQHASPFDVVYSDAATLMILCCRRMMFTLIDAAAATPRAMLLFYCCCYMLRYFATLFAR